jgi:hypothetical protein
MKKIVIIIITLLIVTSCKSTKPQCDSYGQLQKVEKKSV